MLTLYSNLVLIWDSSNYFVSPYSRLSSHLSLQFNQKIICNENFLNLWLIKFTSLNFCELKSTPATLYQLTIFILCGGGIMAHRLNTWQTLIYLYTIFSIGPQWENRYEVTLNLTQPHLPWVFMTYHDHSHPIKTNTYEPPYLAQI